MASAGEARQHAENDRHSEDCEVPFCPVCWARIIGCEVDDLEITVVGDE